jgi:hypothetical protein
MMTNNTIQCPKCKSDVEITKAVEAQLAERIRGEVLAAVSSREKAVSEQLGRMENEKRAIEQARGEVQDRIRQGVEAARTQVEAEALAKAKKSVDLEYQAQSDRIKQLEQEAESSRKVQLDIIRRERALKDQEAALEIEIAKRISAESDAIRAAAKKQAEEAHILKDKEAQEQNSTLRRQVEELRRKLEQGSQQAQGEALELILEDALKRAFPQDSIDEIAKGVNGGDWLQGVVLPNGLECGSILWETKNAKNWSAGWLKKLRSDQREAKAAFAVLVTEAMPAGYHHIAEIDEVWVCTRACAMTLGAALRTGLIEVAKARAASEGRHSKIERVYDYLSGTEFRQRVAAVVEQLGALKSGLDAERRAMMRIWAAREKQIEGAVHAMNGMYGDLQGIVGAGLPTIEGMELPRLGTDEE